MADEEQGGVESGPALGDAGRRALEALRGSRTPVVVEIPNDAPTTAPADATAMPSFPSGVQFFDADEEVQAEYNSPEKISARTEAFQLLQQINGLPAEVRELLKEEQASLITALHTGKMQFVDKGRIEAAIQDAKTEVAVRASETPEQRASRIWGEIKELNRKIDRSFEELEAAGANISPEEKKKRADLRAKIEAEGDPKARIEAIRELATLDRSILERIKKERPDLARQIDEVMMPVIRKRDEEANNLHDLVNLQSTGMTPTPRSTPLKESNNTTFGGFGSEETTHSTLTKEAKAAVAPTLTASFSGYDAPEGAPAQTPGVKPKEAPTRQS